jgi:alkanesulfonate monooxygenase
MGKVMQIEAATAASAEHRSGREVALFTTCPQSKDHDRRDYLTRVAEISRWSEEIGCKGMLIYSDNSLVDPWLIAQFVIQNTRQLDPLVAVQPVLMHPYSLAKLISSIGHLHDRRIALNMVAGGFRNDLIALGDTVEHDDRYARLTEYTQVIRRLLEGGSVDLAGRYYAVQNLKLTPALPQELFPAIFISGSSPAGLAAAAAIGAIAVRYPQPPEFEATDRDAIAATRCGVRLGLIVREDGEEAWRVAFERFPADRRGQIAHQLAMKVSDSAWHKQLSELGERPVSGDSPYWLSPMQNYKTFCPYLVGSYSRVALELKRYISLGFLNFILDIPSSREELAHVVEAFRAIQETDVPAAETTTN